MIDSVIVHLPHRALISVSGPDWASFLKGLCTAHIDPLAEAANKGEFLKPYYGAFLRPQGKMICDALLHAVSADEVRIDVPLCERDELVAKLNMYRLRAKVTIAPLDLPVHVAFGRNLPDGFMADPRKSIIDLNFGMAYGWTGEASDLTAWTTFRFAQGLSDPGLDFARDDLYPIDANLDLLGAIDFHKGCYVGQELTSRMKRRGQIKNRILPFRYAGNRSPGAGAEVLSGERRAGHVLAAENGLGLGLIRVDRRFGALSADDTELVLHIPNWIAPHLPEIDAAGV
ncbi:hypothetical protein AEAC466_14120 [Asticcacaulis sp. AC466]|uniref:CAF17-like 4Fe-4S cluster assembly/insertion protein YgfZ n=1 Tax=Asticcacaulis sp. AC466 TaxID=1282362 RepID=UPI0003C3E50E|nr:folate-binding protein YgfZ [Asticcacaulis sp. AC466]ESQ83381.1 hypothetical protein AEAC466_14120 [Asticcacaulis sp. AC466]